MAQRASFAMRVAFAAAAGVLILAGASMSAGAGRPGSDVLVPAIAGPMAIGSLLVTLLSVHFDFANPNLPFYIGGLLLLALGGVTGVTAYRSFSDALTRDNDSMAGMQAQLEEKHRAFLAATQDAD